MALIGTLTDTFDDGTVDAVKWPNSYGPISETGGRARVTCDTGYTGFKSATGYTLTGSGFALRAWPPAAGGGTSAASSILILTTVGGTDAGFIIDAAQTALGIYLRSGYFDPAPVFLTYDPVAHAWLRLTESAGGVTWDTSPDGVTWTTRRTAATPAWAADTDLAFVLEAHRDAGTNDFAEFDNLNIPPGQTAALGVADETHNAQTLGTSKTAALPGAGEAGTAQALTGGKALVVASAGEADAAQSFVGSKAAPLGATQAVDGAQPIAALKTHTVATAGANEQAQTLGRRKTLSLTTAVESDTSLALGITGGAPDDLSYTVGEPAGRWRVSAPWI